MKRAVLLAVLAACPSPGPRAPGAGGTASTGGPRGAALVPGRAPRLVVVLVIDQLPEWSLEQKLPALTGGGFSRLVSEGEWHMGHHPSAATLTAPGHTLLGTGKPPAYSGILGNEWWSRVDQRIVYAVEPDDTTKFLKVPGLGDAIARAHTGAKAVAVSLKDRASRLPLGKHGLAIWYDARTATWTGNGDSLGTVAVGPAPDGSMTPVHGAAPAPATTASGSSTGALTTTAAPTTAATKWGSSTGALTAANAPTAPATTAPATTAPATTASAPTTAAPITTATTTAAPITTATTTTATTTAATTAAPTTAATTAAATTTAATTTAATTTAATTSGSSTGAPTTAAPTTTAATTTAAPSLAPAKTPTAAASAHLTKLPAWLAKLPPIAPRITTWMPLDADRIAKLSGVPDAQPGEVGEKGFGPTFPHDPAKTAAPYDAVFAMPLGNEIVLETALAAIDGEGLGRDNQPDLLFVSLSAHDYIAHGWGHESWEAWDCLLRLDGQLGHFLDELDRKLGAGNWSMVVTSDHGGAHLPELTGGGRISFDQLVTAANNAAIAELGPGTWVSNAHYPYVFLSPATLAQSKREIAIVIKKIEYALRSFPGIARAGRVDTYAGHCETRTGDDKALCLTFDPQRAGEIFYLPAKNWVMQEESEPLATAHGSLNDYDRDVPVILLPFGHAKHAADLKPRDQIGLEEVAPLVAAWLGSVTTSLLAAQFAHEVVK